jgi:nitric oxide reductase large subunit
MDQSWKKEAVSDVINLALGAWLFLTPWIFGFVSDTAASWSAWLSGIAIGAVAIAALAAFAEWEEWISLALGVWVAVSAWILGFAANATVTWVNVLTGIVVAVVAVIRLWFMHRTPPRVTA